MRPGGRGRPGWGGAAAGAGRGGGGLPGGPQQPGDRVTAVVIAVVVALPHDVKRGAARGALSRGAWCGPPDRGAGPGGQPVVVDVRCCCYCYYLLSTSWCTS